MEEIEKNKISIKALTSTIVTLTSHIERLQAAPAGGASASANIKAKAEGTHSEPNITFQERTTFTDCAPISGGPVSETVSLTESSNEVSTPILDLTAYMLLNSQNLLGRSTSGLIEPIAGAPRYLSPSHIVG